MGNLESSRPHWKSTRGKPGIREEFQFRYPRFNWRLWTRQNHWRASTTCSWVAFRASTGAEPTRTCGYNPRVSYQLCIEWLELQEFPSPSESEGTTCCESSRSKVGCDLSKPNHSNGGCTEPASGPWALIYMAWSLADHCKIDGVRYSIWIKASK